MDVEKRMYDEDEIDDLIKIEREACARIADNWRTAFSREPYLEGVRHASIDIAAAIRARGGDTDATTAP